MQTKITLTDRDGHILKSIFIPGSGHDRRAIGRAKKELMSIHPDGYVFVTHVGNGAEND